MKDSVTFFWFITVLAIISVACTQVNGATSPTTMSKRAANPSLWISHGVNKITHYLKAKLKVGMSQKFNKLTAIASTAAQSCWNLFLSSACT